jgi:hypothetical protein
MSKVGQGSQVLARRLANSRLSHSNGLHMGGDRRLSQMGRVEVNGYIGDLAKQVSGLPRGKQVLLGSSARHELVPQAEYAQAGFVPGAFYENRQGNGAVTSQLTFCSADKLWNQFLLRHDGDPSSLNGLLGLVKGRAGIVASSMDFMDFQVGNQGGLLKSSYVLVARPDELKQALGIDTSSLQDLGGMMMEQLVTLARGATRSERDRTSMHHQSQEYPDRPNVGPAMDLVNEDGITKVSSWLVLAYKAPAMLWLASIPGFPEYMYVALTMFTPHNEELAAEDFPKGWFELADQLAGESPDFSDTRGRSEEAARAAFYRAVGTLMYLQINQGYT